MFRSWKEWCLVIGLDVRIARGIVSRMQQTDPQVRRVHFYFVNVIRYSGYAWGCNGQPPAAVRSPSSPQHSQRQRNRYLTLSIMVCDKDTWPLHVVDSRVIQRLTLRIANVGGQRINLKEQTQVLNDSACSRSSLERNTILALWTTHLPFTVLANDYPAGHNILLTMSIRDSVRRVC
jgi:hypothetical protein